MTTGQYNMEGQVINRRWKCTQKLGEGSFGAVYKAVQVRTGQEVAIKFEPRSGTDAKFEFTMYKALEPSPPGIPKAFYYGSTSKSNVLVLELLWKSLEDLLTFVGGRMSLKTVLMLGDQMIARLEHIHSRGYIHRDIKSENFMMGSGSGQKHLYIIDFGLSKKYISGRRHMGYRTDRSLVGTARFVSLNVHLGIEPSRRDDLESIGYLILYLLRGELPWQGIPASTREKKYERIAQYKKTMSFSNLCNGFPNELVVFFKYVRNLKFDEKPDYAYLRNMLREVMNRKGYAYDYRYDWVELLAGGKRVSQFRRGPGDRRSRSREVNRNHSRAMGPNRGRNGGGGCTIL